MDEEQLEEILKGGDEPDSLILIKNFAYFDNNSWSLVVEVDFGQVQARFRIDNFLNKKIPLSKSHQVFWVKTEPETCESFLKPIGGGGKLLTRLCGPRFSELPCLAWIDPETLKAE